MKQTVLSTVTAIAALVFGCCDLLAENPPLGIQLYSARDLIGTPEKYASKHKDVLKQLSQMGYVCLETASYADGKIYGISPEEFKADCKAASLVPLSTHTTRNLSAEEYRSGKPTKETLDWWETCIKAHKATGMKFIVAPSVYFPLSESSVPKTLAELRTYCEYLDAVGKMVSRAGMEFGYHNHSSEFSKVEGELMYDYMLSHTNPDYVFFEMDVYWAVIGDASPVDYFKNNPGRFHLLHIKDQREIGQSGMVGFDAIFANAKTAGAKAVIVEVERYSYDDVMRSISESAAYLQNAGFVK